MQCIRLSEIALATVLCTFVMANDGRILFKEQTDGCTTALGNLGLCVSFEECPPFSQLLPKRNNKTVTDYLNKSICAHNGKHPKMCCEADMVDYHLRSRWSSINSDLPSPPKCGRPAYIDNTRIIHGQPAELGAWPWMVALGFHYQKMLQLYWLCGGTLITNRHIITAAHCNKEPHYTMYIARMGDLDLNPFINDGASSQDIRIEQVIPHPDHNAFRFNDIALVKLREEVKLTPLIQPICLPTPELKAKDLVGFEPFVAGWGRTSNGGSTATRLQQIQVPIVSNEDCHAKYRKKGAVIIPQQLCAGFSKGEKDACSGDSGGPMMFPKGEYFYLIGVVSYGYRCAEPGFPGIYTRVAEYTDWIKETLQK